jgi:hypothetical protein
VRFFCHKFDAQALPFCALRAGFSNGSAGSLVDRLRLWPDEYFTGDMIV